MSQEAPTHVSPVSVASPRLLAAALSGLLGLGAGCGDGDGERQRGDAGAGDADAGDADAGDAGVDAAQSQSGVTLSRMDTTITLESFTQLCEAADGKLEQHAHCGGVNSCKGFSYDITIHTYTEHTCKGLNTCTGYSCVLPSEG